MEDTPAAAAAQDEAHERTTQMTEKIVLEELERQYVAVREDRDRLQQELQTARNKLAAADRESVSLLDLESQIAHQQHQVSLSKEKIQALEEEKQLGQERLDRVQVEADNLREEIR